MKKRFFLFCLFLLTTAVYGKDTIQYLNTDSKIKTGSIIQVNSKKRRLNTFLGNPRYKYRKIRSILKDAQQKILNQRGFLNDYISEIIRNENSIAATSDEQKIHSLIRINITLFRKIERIRIRIARIQLDAQQKVLRIERQSYISIIGSAKRQHRRIHRNPSAYWLWRRKHLLNRSELKDSLPNNLIRKYYNK